MDRIEKQVELKATTARVWRALTDSREFGEWFGCVFTEPFEVGKAITGRITYPGYEHLTMEVLVERMDGGVFAYRWHPYAIDAAVDYSGEATTLVEFTVEAMEGEAGSQGTGSARTRLRVTESGFEGVPAGRRSEAFRMNVRGWEQQMESIERYLAARG